MKRIVALSLIFLFLCSGLCCFAQKRTCLICTRLAEAGFPASYRDALCALKTQHPTWCFTPLFVSREAKKEGKDYSFSRVLEEECVAGRSLISGKEEYAPYRPEGGGVYDSGYYPSSRETVAYFLDPRSHLTQEGIFQFLLFSHIPVSREDLEALLSQVEWRERVTGELILSVSERAGVSPLLLTVRLLGEQGREGNPLLWGETGSCLAGWYHKGEEYEGDRLIAPPAHVVSVGSLLSLNGYYNPLHDGATGQGSFAIYQNAAMRAKEKGWDSLEKGLFGGAEKLGREYEDRYQETLYLQKFNVDVRSRTDSGESRNFWGQYMQNIAAPLREGQSLFALLEERGLLSLPLVFSVPVYEAMPEDPGPDPAAGSAFSLSSGPIPTPTHLFSEPEADPEDSKEQGMLSLTATLPNGENKEEDPPFHPLLLTGVWTVLFLLFSYFFRCAIRRFFSPKNKFSSK